jgi:proteasome lid subunit RPN8/RPN11
MTVLAANLPEQEQDLSAINAGEWPVRQFPLGPRDRPTRRQIIVKQEVLNDVYAHGLSAPDIEVCGVLVGNVYRDHVGAFVFIEAGIRGNFSAGKSAHVTFTADTWTHIQNVMDRDFPDLRILGWYHTHPGHGIFLSDMYLFIHQNFFNLPWHVALVYDPQQQEEGLFAWRNANLMIESFVVQKDVPPLARVARRVPELPMQHGAAQSLDSQEAGPLDGPIDYRTLVPMKRPTEEQKTPEPFSSAPLESPGAVALAAVTAAADASARAAQLARASGAAPLVNLTRPASENSAEMSDLSLRVQTLERRQRWMVAVTALAVLIAVAWPLALAGYSMLHSSSSGIPDPLIPQPQFNASTSADPPHPAQKSRSSDDVTHPSRQTAVSHG